MSLDYYTTDEEREKYIKKVDDDEYLLYAIREKCRDYVDFLIQFATSTRKDLLSIESAEDAVRIHGDVSGISKLLKAFGIGLDQSVMNEPTEIDLKDWANLSLFRVAIIRRKFSAAKIFIEKTGSAEYLIKIETMLFSIHKFLTTGDWDDDEVEMLEQENFFDTSFLSDQSIVDEAPVVVQPPPPPKKVEEKKEKSKNKKKKNEDKEKEEKEKEKEKEEKEKQEKIEKEEKEKENERNEKEKKEAEEKDGEEENKNNNEEKESKDETEEEIGNGKEDSSVTPAHLNLELKAAKLKSPIGDRRANFMAVKRKSFGNLFRGRVNNTEEKENLSNKESYLRDSISIMEYRAKKFTWQKRWLILNLENIEIYKDEKSVSLSKSIPISSITKIEEPIEEFDLVTSSTFGLGKKSVRVTKDLFENEENSEKKIFVVESNYKGTQNFCFQTKNNRDLLKWLITIDSLIELNRSPLIDSSLKLKYLTSNESHSNTGTIQNENHIWKYDGKRFKLKNRNSNLTFSWTGERLKQRGGDNIGVIDWNGVSLKWAKYENVKFTWIEADKEFLVQAGTNSHSWNYNGESLYRKDDKSVNFIVKNRPPIGIIIAVCVISSFLSNLPLWEIQTPKTPAQRNEEIIASKKASRVKKGILSSTSKTRLAFSSRKKGDDELKDSKEKEKEKENELKESGEGKKEGVEIVEIDSGDDKTKLKDSKEKNDEKKDEKDDDKKDEKEEEKKEEKKEEKYPKSPKDDKRKKVEKDEKKEEKEEEKKEEKYPPKSPRDDKRKKVEKEEEKKEEKKEEKYPPKSPKDDRRKKVEKDENNNNNSNNNNGNLAKSPRSKQKKEDEKYPPKSPKDDRRKKVEKEEKKEEKVEEKEEKYPPKSPKDDKRKKVEKDDKLRESKEKKEEIPPKSPKGKQKKEDEKKEEDEDIKDDKKKKKRSKSVKDRQTPNSP